MDHLVICVQTKRKIFSVGDATWDSCKLDAVKSIVKHNFIYSHVYLQYPFRRAFFILFYFCCGFISIAWYILKGKM